MDKMHLMNERLIDLHVHTSFSDGSMTPAEVISIAAESGAAAIAITDHDTVAGLDEGSDAAVGAGIEFIAGVEISAEYSPGAMHILGYFIDWKSCSLLASLEELRGARERRNPGIAERLRELGFNVTYEEVTSIAGTEQVGRPHFARLLYEKGYVSSVQEGFDKYLAKGAKAYVDKARLSPSDSIRVIHGAGGIAALAHPYQLGELSSDDLHTVVRDLMGKGLDGIEAYYSRHSESQQIIYLEMARKYGLVITGGSDFHGRFKPDIAIIRGLGNLCVPSIILDDMKKRREMLGSSCQ